MNTLTSDIAWIGGLVIFNNVVLFIIWWRLLQTHKQLVDVLKRQSQFVGDLNRLTKLVRNKQSR